MSTPKNPDSEHPSTYFVQDRSDEAELIRLQVQDQMVTNRMGGVLPEQVEPERFRRVLDVGCGTGGWLIEMAKTYPGISLLLGVDVSGRMLDFAREQAKAQQVSERVEFHIMDALRMLEFPHDYFDLVNQRFGISYLRTWDWPKLLQEYQRVTRPGGVIRVTDTSLVTESNSPALTHIGELWLKAFFQAGHLFTPEGDGLINQLARMLQQHGLRDVQTRSYTVEYRAGTPAWELFVEDARHFLLTVVPFLQKWTRVPDDYEDIYQQALHEIQQPGFVATGSLLTAWGIRPSKAG